MIFGRFVPSVSQERWFDCGPAVLQSILKWHGLSVTQRRLAEDMNAGPWGVSWQTLGSTAQKYGYRPILRKIAYRDLLSTVAFQPLVLQVASWKQVGRLHYVILDGVGATAPILYYLMDPHVEGNRRILTPAELNERWAEPSDRFAMLLQR